MTDTYVAQRSGSGNGTGCGNRRIVTLDLESVSLDPNDPRGALGTGGKGVAPGEKMQIVVAGMFVDDGRRLTPVPVVDQDERRLLKNFWGTLRPDDTIVGHNVREFDLARIKQRSWIVGVEPSFDVSMAKYRENQVYDVMDMWTNWGRPDGASLDNISRALGVGKKTGHGSQVDQLWREERYRELLDYCMQDVHLTYLIYCRMKFRQPLDFNLPEQEPLPAAQQYESRVPPARVTAPLFDVREPEPQPNYVNSASEGRYRYVSDGNGRMRELAIEPEAAAAAPPVRGFAAGAPAEVQGPPNSTALFTAWRGWGRGDGGAGTSAQKPQYGAKPRSRSKRVLYVVNGDRLIVNGGTFAIKDSLKAMGARPTGEGQTFAWELPAEKFDQLAGLCSRNGLQLTPAQREAA